MSSLDGSTETTCHTPPAIDKFRRFIKDLPFMPLNALKPELNQNKTVDEISWSIGKATVGTECFSVDFDRTGVFTTDEEATTFNRIAARAGHHSRHGVFFGEIAFAGGLVTKSVAIKPFHSEEGGKKSAINEVSCSLKVLGAGHETFRPFALGVYDDTTFTFWELVKGASTLDSIDWTDFTEDPENQPGQISILKKSALEIASIHNKSWRHGDLSPRNIATDIGGNIMLIDWEDAFLDGDPTDNSVKHENALQDNKAFLLSGVFNSSHPYNPGIGWLSNMSVGNAIYKYEKYFLNTYLAERYRLSPGKLTKDELGVLKRDLVNILEDNISA